MRNTYGRVGLERPVPGGHDMKATFPHVHYSDDYWNKARTIWGAEEKDLGYEYSDRLWQRDYDKDERCRKEADEKLGRHVFNPEWIQLYLSLYYGKPVELRHVLAGVNVSNGYPYYVYGFRTKEG